MEGQPKPFDQQQFLDQVAAFHQTIEDLSLSALPEQDQSDSSSSSSDYESDEYDPQAILNKAGCTTQLSNLELTPEGIVSEEVQIECLQCMLYNKLLASLILCKAIFNLQPSNLVSYICQNMISTKLQQQQEQEFDSSDTTESGSDSEIGSDDSCDSDSDSDSEGKDSSDESQDEVKEEDTHSCPACTD